MKKISKVISLITLLYFNSIVCAMEEKGTSEEGENNDANLEKGASEEGEDNNAHNIEKIEASLIQSGAPNSSIWLYVKNRAYVTSKHLFEKPGLSLCKSVFR